MEKQAYFICPECESTSVTRPANMERPVPRCLSCDEATGGKADMVWVEDIDTEGLSR